jgi:gluconolactonase
MGVTNPPLPSALYHLNPKGQLTRITASIARPNGVALSPDERRLYVANTAGNWIIAFSLDRRGRVTGRRKFAQLALPPPANAQAAASTASGADGMAVDARGRLLVATTIGVQVFSARGAPLGVIVLPRQPQNLAFGGWNRSTLYVVGRGAVYRIDTRTTGPKRAGK